MKTNPAAPVGDEAISAGSPSLMGLLWSLRLALARLVLKTDK